MRAWRAVMVFVFGADMNVPNQWPEQFVDQPTLEDLEALLWENKEFPCTDGCLVSFPIAVCCHLHPTWYVVLGIDPADYGITIVDV